MLSSPPLSVVVWRWTGSPIYPTSGLVVDQASACPLLVNLNSSNVQILPWERKKSTDWNTESTLVSSSPLLQKKESEGKFPLPEQS